MLTSCNMRSSAGIHAIFHKRRSDLQLDLVISSNQSSSPLVRRLGQGRVDLLHVIRRLGDMAARSDDSPGIRPRVIVSPSDSRECGRRDRAIREALLPV